ncbi:MAG TPA: coproporphyrinogen-III oxidase family protein [Blastocatellia bacterium]|nr:coproporphyrinogen-III oxidase family protein [Blastocatellia bacterium]
MISIDVDKRSAPFIVEYPSFDRMRLLDGREGIEASIARLEGSISLYLHIPFCRHRCDFCYYRVLTNSSQELRRLYLRSLLREISFYGRLVPGRAVEVATIYWGGGTPSYLSAEEMAQIHNAVQKNFRIAPKVEFTVEVEPGTATPEKLQVLNEIGANRLSIGAQHFNDLILKANGRPHRAAATYRCVELARASGFWNVNIDLISGLLGDSPALWPDLMSAVLALQPESVSIYRLQVLPNTILAQTGELPFENAVLAPTVETEIADFAYQTLEGQGYLPDTSFSFTKGTAFAHRHRRFAWTDTPMLGLGVSAYSTLPGLMFQNSRSFENYLADTAQGRWAVKRAHLLSAEEAAIRTFVLGVKLGRVRFAELAPSLLDSAIAAARDLADWELATATDIGFDLSRRGRILADDIIAWYLRQAGLTRAQGDLSVGPRAADGHRAVSSQPSPSGKLVSLLRRAK